MQRRDAPLRLAAARVSHDVRAQGAPRVRAFRLGASRRPPPAQAETTPDLADFADVGGWQRVLAAGDPSAAAERLGLGYLDRKWTLVAGRAAGPLSFAIPASDVQAGNLVLCSATTGWRRPPNLGDLKADAVLSIHDDGPAGPGRALRLNALRQVDNCFQTRIPSRRESPPRDRLDFSLRVESDNEVYLSHVLWG